MTTTDITTMSIQDMQNEISFHEAQAETYRKEIAARIKAEKKQNIKALKEQMALLGISSEELAGVAAAVTGEAKAVRTPAKPKYRIGDKTWTGRGIAPAAFKEAKANGTLDQYLI